MTIYIAQKQHYRSIYNNYNNHLYFSVSIDNKTVKKLAKTGLLGFDKADLFEIGSRSYHITKKLLKFPRNIDTHIKFIERNHPVLTLQQHHTPDQTV